MSKKAKEYLTRQEAREMQTLISHFYDLQQGRIGLGNRTSNHLQNGWISETRAQDLQVMTKQSFESVEKFVYKQFKPMIKKHPLWTQWLVDVRGIGDTFAGLLIAKVAYKRQGQYELDGQRQWKAHPEDFPVHAREGLAEQFGEFTGKTRQGIRCFPYSSHLNSYVGLGLDDEGDAQKRKRGEQSNWNEFLKTRMYLVGESFVKLGRQYRLVYDHYRQIEQIKMDKKHELAAKTPKHAHNRAMRHAVKIFLNHFHAMARIYEGLEPQKPYIFTQPEEGQHTHYIPPLRDKGEWPEGIMEKFTGFGPLPPYLE